MLRFLTSGESHGMALVGIIEGLPAGLRLVEDDINTMLSRRQRCYGRGNRMKKIEDDRVTIVSGVRNGLTIGSPLALYIENKDWPNRKGRVPAPKRTPRPGHADLPGVLKYGFDDIQNVIERASARETTIRTAIGAVAKRFLSEFDIAILGHVIRIGNKSSKASSQSIKDILSRVESSPVYCADIKSSSAICSEIDKALSAGDTLGGSFEVIVENIPPGLGTYVHWDRRLDARLAHIIMSIPSVKAVEIGDGVKTASLPGSKVHDQLSEKENAIIRKTNRAGGIEGGISNGNPIIVRGYVKPISSLRNPLASVNLDTRQKIKAPYVRSDVCIVPAASVIGEALVSWVIAELFVEKFGGDSIREIRRNYDSYMSEIHSRIGKPRNR